MRKEVIGNCTLYQGDCLDILAGLPSVSICIADPPYSSGGMMRSDRINDPAKKYCNGDYARSFGGDNRDQRSFTLWASWWMSELLLAVRESGYFLCFTDWRQLACVTDAVQVAGFIYRGIIPWNKTEVARPQRGCFRSQCEYAVWATRGALGSSEVLPGFITCSAPTGEERVHPTQKPVEVISHLIRIQPQGVVLDPFMGSGTTGVACVQAGREFIGIEQDAYWFGVACRRIEQAYQRRSLLDMAVA